MSSLQVRLAAVMRIASDEMVTCILPGAAAPSKSPSKSDVCSLTLVYTDA